MDLSLLPGKPVLSPLGEAVGYVKCVYVCKNRVSSLVCVDDGEEEFYLPAKGVRIAEDGVTAGKTRLKAPVGAPCAVGRAAFDRAGRFLGYCCGLDPEAGVFALSRSEEPYPLSRMTAGDVLLVSAPPAEQKKTARSAKNATQVAKTEVQWGAEREFGPLGKRVKKQVAGVAQTGETVTPATLKLARENNKLLELTANTLTE